MNRGPVIIFTGKRGEKPVAFRKFRSFDAMMSPIPFFFNIAVEWLVQCPWGKKGPEDYLHGVPMRFQQIAWYIEIY